MTVPDEWALAFLKWIGGAAAAAGVAWTALNNRITQLEKHKADAAAVGVMANDISHMKQTLDRIERKLERSEE